MSAEMLRKALDQWVKAPLCPKAWPLLAVAVFVFAAPNIDFFPSLQWHDGQRLAQLLLLAVVLATFLIPGIWRDVAGTWVLLPPSVRGALALVFILGIVSTIQAPLPRWALLEWSLFWLLIVLVLFIAGQFRQHGQKAEVAMVVLIFATAMAYSTSASVVYVSMLLFAADYGQIFDIRELYVSFSNMRFFGHIQTMLLPFLLLPAMWWGNTSMRRVALWIVPGIWWTLVVASGTRGTWVALFLGLVAVALYSVSVGRRWMKWQFAGLVCGLACYGLFILMIPKWLNQPAWLLQRAGEIMTLSLRDVLWRNALTFTADHPFFGVGPMHYAYSATVVGAHPHNALLQWSAEWGLPSAVLFFGICAFAGLAYARYVRYQSGLAAERPAMFRTAMLAALTGAAAQAMVDGVLVMPVSQTILAGLCGCAIAMTYADEAVPGKEKRPAWLAVVTVFAAAGLVYGVMPEITRIEERERAYLAASPPDTQLLPRFWTHGLIGR